MNNIVKSFIRNNIVTSFTCGVAGVVGFYRKSFSNQGRADCTDVLVGVFAIITAMSISHLVQKEVQIIYPALFDFAYHSILICASILLTYNVWSPLLKNETFIAILRSVIFPYILIFVPTVVVLTSNFGQFQIMLLLVNIMIFALIVRWQIALVALLLSTHFSLKLYEFFANSIVISPIESQAALKFKIIYASVLICGVIIAFLKPKQEEQELSEELAEHLKNQLADQEAELAEATSLKYEFLRNLQHETNTPLTGMCSMSQALSELYDKLSDKDRKRAINTIAKSSNRLISYVSNLVDVSKLTGSLYETKMRFINISNLAYAAIRRCQKLYILAEEGESRDFIINIEPDVIGKCDEYLIKRSFENIIINAIQYCKKGTITITLAKSQRADSNQSQAEGQNRSSKIIFSVRDEGIGIPPQDLSSIFEPFMTSTKTKTPAGGRGVGLALVKKVAQLHKGTVTAESNEQVESLFTLSLPLG